MRRELMLLPLNTGTFVTDVDAVVVENPLVEQNQTGKLQTGQHRGEYRVGSFFKIQLHVGRPWVSYHSKYVVYR